MPQVMPDALDSDEYFVHMPLASGRGRRRRIACAQPLASPPYRR